ncbi:MAG: SIMPL domain-containing protein [Patescibacteria group bacterium]
MEETKTIEISQRLFMLIGGLIAIIALFMAGRLLYQFKSLPQNFPQEITVSGEGKAYAKPDVALVTLGANTKGFKSQDVVNRNNEIMNAVIKSVKDLGVDEKDIQTTMYNLSPEYDYTEKGRVFKGYSLNQQISVKIRNFDAISNILDKAASNGANAIGDLRFTVDDMEKVKAEARQKAIAQAKEKALSLFKQSGLEAIKLVNISEGYGPVPFPAYGKGAGGAAFEASVAPQIEVGQTEVSAVINLTYRVR